MKEWGYPIDISLFCGEKNSDHRKKKGLLAPVIEQLTTITPHYDGEIYYYSY